jgi:hypothetical protein
VKAITWPVPYGGNASALLIPQFSRFQNKGISIWVTHRIAASDGQYYSIQDLENRSRSVGIGVSEGD